MLLTKLLWPSVSVPRDDLQFNTNLRDWQLWQFSDWMDTLQAHSADWKDSESCKNIAKPRRFDAHVTAVDISVPAVTYCKSSGIADAKAISGATTVAASSVTASTSVEVTNGPKMTASGLEKITAIASATDTDISLSPGGTGKVKTTATFQAGSLQNKDC